jgi:hypothetical protein
VTGEIAEERYLRLLGEIRALIDDNQALPELLLRKIEELRAVENSQIVEGNSESEGPSGHNSQRIAEIVNTILSGENSSSNEPIDRQSLSVQIRQIAGARTTIRDERIRHSEGGGLHSQVEQAIVISCEGKRIEAQTAEGLCEVTGKLAQKALSCRLCHRSICLRHCEFLEVDGEHYPYCNTPPPKSRISCIKRTITSIDTWRELEKRARNRRHR